MQLELVQPTPLSTPSLAQAFLGAVRMAAEELQGRQQGLTVCRSSRAGPDLYSTRGYAHAPEYGNSCKQCLLAPPCTAGLLLPTESIRGSPVHLQFLVTTMWPESESCVLPSFSSFVDPVNTIANSFILLSLLTSSL
ncbi:hypothetical protein KIL84_017562 [Mauremys mutica]|uniref:Uncharacterized protein n=1 Tax=Mauremys mutica TaxID=74926 RepID=A0A9D3X6E1_9SAUR|nr:hypothetical protein KIL84_017562 [Mauremys mutica]